MLKIVLASSALVLSVVITNQTAWAVGEPKGESGMRQACQEDVKKFCADIKPGEGRIHQCLSQHEAKLSAACRDARGQVKARLERFEKACGGDIQKHCSDIKPGSGRVVKCLKAKEAELSPSCKAELGAGPGAGKPKDKEKAKDKDKPKDK